MKKCTLLVCPKVYKRIEKLKTFASGWIPRWQGGDQFEVVGSSNGQYKVDITHRSCGCKKWDLSGIPCTHAIAALNYLDHDIYDYVHDCYKIPTYLKTYSHLLNPINGRDLWPETNNFSLLPPDVEKKFGRPKKARRRELEEPTDPTKFGRKGIKMTCKLCGKVGHNKRTCKNKNAAATSGGQDQTTAPATANAPAQVTNESLGKKSMTMSAKLAISTNQQ
ncbi:hypothetical protein Vadar_026624 [Vaccinium darrowii]|uniref:Uncharacterized protein n=1 Tax=Vaccinium darrowii TaxID=229202 RepID=A0ACB7Y931_9ERIC|nr:hypothetical protein Vadar_026624 [Vaccinium darrowii]